MNTHTLDIERWVLDLLIVLKHESEAMGQISMWLAQLQERVMQRDEPALEALLKEIRTNENLMPELERKRQSIRGDLATVLGLPFEQLTLTRLEDLLTGDLQNQVSQMKTQLQIQTGALQTQRQGAVMFLADCTRLNRQLLNSVFDNTQQSHTTYSARGNAEHQRSSALVNLQF
jgi:hypothetical protein